MTILNPGCRRHLGGRLIIAGIAGILLLSLVSTAPAQLLRRLRRVPAAPAQPSGPVTEKEALETGIEAYIYGYPLVTMEMTRRVMTNVEKPEGTRRRWATCFGLEVIPMPSTGTLRHPTPIPYTRPHGWMSARSRGC